MKSWWRASAFACLSATACLCAFLWAGAAQASDEALVLRQSAEQLALQERCAEALTRAQRARQLDPRDSRAALLEGRCQLRLRRYAEAIDALEAGRALDPDAEGVALDLAQAHYHLDQLEAARRELERASEQGPDSARLHLYSGLVSSRLARDAEAAASFDRAGQLNPRLDGVASLYAGRAWARAQESRKAREAFERARRADPSSDWGVEADRELDQLEEQSRLPIWVQVMGGFEYDSNVTLRPPSEELAFGPAGGVTAERSDVRGIWQADIGSEFYRDDDTAVGGLVGYRGNAHRTFHVFDLQSPYVSFWLDQQLDEATSLRIQPSAGYTWLETDPFVAWGGGRASLSHTWDSRWSGQLYAQLYYYDYLFSLQGTPLQQQLRDRDGWNPEFGSEMRRSFADTGTVLRFGAAYDRYLSEGEDWERDGGRAWAAVRQDLPGPFHLDLEGGYAHHRYEHPSSFSPGFPNSRKRRDHLYTAGAALGYELSENWLLRGHYRYAQTESNLGNFEYDRHIVGGTVTFFWAR